MSSRRKSTKGSSSVSYVYVVLPVVLVAAAAWLFTTKTRRPELAKSTAETATKSASNLEAVLTNLSAEAFAAPFMDGEGSREVEKRRERGDADRLMKDPANLQKPLIANLVQRAQDAMDALIPPEKQRPCFRPATNVEQVLQNIGSVIHDSFASQADLSDPSYMYSLTTLMLVRYSLVSAAEDRRDLITIKKDSTGRVATVTLRPRMARVLSGMVDKVFDRYYELSPPMQKFVDQYQQPLEVQFGINMSEVKATNKGAKKPESTKVVKSGALMSAAGRTLPVNLFAAVMVMLASGEAPVRCAVVPDDVAL